MSRFVAHIMPNLRSAWFPQGLEGMMMPIINHQEIPEIEMRPGIRGQFRASTEYGARTVCLLVKTVAPGATAPLHKHTVEETMLVLEGTVWVRIGDERYTVGPQHTVIIP